MNEILLDSPKLLYPDNRTSSFKTEFNSYLSFSGQQLLTDRHKIHPYPAMLHPLLVDYLLDEYSNKNSVVFDPFCGSGVTLLQASLKQMMSIGYDINPLALLISQVKNQFFDVESLKMDLNRFVDDVYSANNHCIPVINNIDYWYKDEIINELGKIRFVLKNNSYTYYNFFLICFALICRELSFTRKNEFKRYRIEQSKIVSFMGNPTNKLFEHINKYIEILSDSKQPARYPIIQMKNSEYHVDKNHNYDLVITSPPYGDSKTTVAYGQYSSFGMDWINDLNPFGKIDYRIDNECLGKKGVLIKDMFENKHLMKTIDIIKAEDPKRSDEVLYFFNGYYKSLKNIVRNLNNGGTICIIVGNRTVKGCQIPMDQITAHYLQEMGLLFQKILVREISNKVMPCRNSPSNKIGKKSNTMKYEYIVIFKKI